MPSPSNTCRPATRTWWVIPFFARFDPDATWFDQLQPLRPEDARWFPHVARTRRIPVPLHDGPDVIRPHREIRRPAEEH